MKIEKTYIDYLNKEKNFQQDRKVFHGDDAYDQAAQWGRMNLENFNIDMVKVDIPQRKNVKDLSSLELNDHYNLSKANYDIKGESHMDFYRDKYPEYFERLKNIANNLSKISPKKNSAKKGLKH